MPIALPLTSGRARRPLRFWTRMQPVHNDRRPSTVCGGRCNGFRLGRRPAAPPPEGSPWRILLFGRVEDAELKGVDLAARAVAQAAERRHRHGQHVELVVRGAEPGTEKQLRDQIHEWAGTPRLDVVVRAYSTDTAALDADLKRASLVLMPSRREGFGLVASEAVVARVPVLATQFSGFGQLVTALVPNEAPRTVVQVPPGADEVDEWSRAIDMVLANREAAFDQAHQLATSLAGLRSWRMAAGVVLEAGNEPRRPD